MREKSQHDDDQHQFICSKLFYYSTLFEIRDCRVTDETWDPPSAGVTHFLMILDQTKTHLNWLQLMMTINICSAQLSHSMNQTRRVPKKLSLIISLEMPNFVIDSCQHQHFLHQCLPAPWFHEYLNSITIKMIQVRDLCNTHINTNETLYQGVTHLMIVVHNH